MIKDAKISIVTRIHSLEDGTDVEEKYEYEGTIAFKPDAVYISYIHTDEGNVRSQNRLIVYEDHLVRTSKGAGFTRMEFVPGKETKTMYTTAYGTFDMTFFTKFYKVQPGSIHINLEYILSINGVPSSENVMIVNACEV